MHVKIKLKLHLLILLGAIALAAITGFLLNFVLAGPRLGAHYDFLLKLKKPQAVSTEILIINTDEIIETLDKFLVLMTLTEMGGANLIMTDKTPASSAQTAATLSVNESEIRRRFFDEYVLLGTNIRNLFEAIRSGSVTPMQAPGYVERLVELTEQGRDRLLTAITDRDEDLIRAIAVFGGYMEASESPVYDKDGKLRRVQPVDPKDLLEHPVYTSLKHRYADSKIESAKENKYLSLKKHDEGVIIIPLDDNGNIITSVNNSRFRSVDISLFREYDEASRIMRELLVYGDSLGALSQTLPEQSPLFLGDYSQIFKEEMLANSDIANRDAWLKSRRDYYKSLEEFVNGQAESLIVKNYNDVIEEEGLASLKSMRDELIQAFVYIRAQYAILQDIRTRLEKEVNASFCIMGTQPNTQYSALLANAIITGSHIKPAANKHVLIWSFIAAFIALCLVFWLKPLAQLLSGLGICILCLVVFSFIFIYFSIWIDPLISFGAGCMGTLVIFICSCLFTSHRIRRFRAAYGSAVSQNVLNELTREGKPHPDQIIESNAAVIAIKDINLLAREDHEKPQDAGKIKRAFFASVKDAVFNAGGVITGFEGDTIIACFGSPLDKTNRPVEKAYSFVKGLLADKNTAWRFGLDAGNCTFYWSQETGFSVHGRPAIRARMLASRTARLKTRALITDYVREELSINAEKIDSLYAQDNTGESIFNFN